MLKQNLPVDDLIACHSCDLLHDRTTLGDGEKAWCSRCGSLLYRTNNNAIEMSLALTIASLLLFLFAHLLPFLSIDIDGNKSTIYLISTIDSLSQLDNILMVIAGALFLVVIPLGVLLLDLLLLSALYSNRRPLTLFARQLLLLIGRVAPWNMLEIFLLGVLVTIVKLASIAEITLHQGFWAFVALVMINLFVSTTLEPEELWQAIDKH
ncbi:MAG TPA: paraquat-inducible protein A [Gammaproteobacteria bacterium]|nr:paraquat-inducible protein A [Gammaproteobacteria bacterium]